VIFYVETHPVVPIAENKTASLKIAIPAASYGVLRDFFPAGSAAFGKHPAAIGGKLTLRD